jgi:hypothetical protein
VKLSYPTKTGKSQNLVQKIKRCYKNTLLFLLLFFNFAPIQDSSAPSPVYGFLPRGEISPKQAVTRVINIIFFHNLFIV